MIQAVKRELQEMTGAGAVTPSLPGMKLVGGFYGKKKTAMVRRPIGGLMNAKYNTAGNPPVAAPVGGGGSVG